MTARKRCPLASGSENESCAMDGCRWWHGEACDMSRIAAQMTVMPALVQLLVGDTTASEFEDAVMRTAEIFAGKEADE